MAHVDEALNNPTEFLDLPAPLLVKILSHLGTFQQIVCVRLVCPTWNRAIMEHSWQEPSHLVVTGYHPSFLSFLKWASTHAHISKLRLNSAAIPAAVTAPLSMMQMQELSFAGHWKLNDSYLFNMSTSLKCLDLSGTNFYLGGPCVDVGLQNLTSLTELRLCRLSNQGRPYGRVVWVQRRLCALTLSNPGLRALYLDDNPKALDNHLLLDALLGAACSAHLHTLSLARCSHITEVGKVCKMLPELKHLNIERTASRDKTVEMVMMSCPNLEYLNIGGCMQITETLRGRMHTPNCVQNGSLRTLLMPDLPRMSKEDVKDLLQSWVQGVLTCARLPSSSLTNQLSLDLSCCGLIDDDVISSLVPLGQHLGNSEGLYPWSPTGDSVNSGRQQQPSDLTSAPYLQTFMLAGGCCHITAGAVARLAASGVYDRLQVLDLSHFNGLRKEPTKLDLSLLSPNLQPHSPQLQCSCGPQNSPRRCNACDICPGTAEQRVTAVGSHEENNGCAMRKLCNADYVPSSQNGNTDHVPSSQNGSTDHVPSSRNGSTDHVPSSQNGSTDHASSSRNGSTDHASSSQNGSTDHVPSSRNGSTDHTSSPHENLGYGPSLQQHEPGTKLHTLGAGQCCSTLAGGDGDDAALAGGQCCAALATDVGDVHHKHLTSHQQTMRGCSESICGIACQCVKCVTSGVGGTPACRNTGTSNCIHTSADVETECGGRGGTVGSTDHEGRDGTVGSTEHGGRDGTVDRTEHGGTDRTVGSTEHGGTDGTVGSTEHGGRDGTVGSAEHGGRDGTVDRTEHGGADRTVGSTEHGGRHGNVNDGRSMATGLQRCAACRWKALLEAANPFYACVAVHLSHIKVLKLDSCWLDDPSACLLAVCCRQLETLHIVGCKALGNEGLAALTGPGNKLQHLSVGGASYSWREDKALQNLESLHTLKVIRRTMLQDAHLVEVLRRTPRLRRLALAVCSSLTDAAFASVPETVEELTLTACDTMQGTTIPRMRRLRRLKMSTCPGITPQALHAIAVSCTRLTHIQLPKHLSESDLPCQATGGHLSYVMVVGEGQLDVSI